MNITEIRVDDFGIWHNLSLSNLDDGAIVLFGPNEAGKTTLLNFVRTVLYGFTEDRRRRYLPPVSGGDGGGSLHVSTAGEGYELHRSASAQPGEGAGRLRINSSAGVPEAGRLLTWLLSGIDETTFNNVFAVGLTQLQQLGALADTEAADQLYGLATGVDRVCLMDAIRALQAQRDAILSAEDETGGLLGQYWKQREKLDRELHILHRDDAHWTELRRRHAQLSREIAQQENTIAQWDGDGHWNHVSETLRNQWSRCLELNQELSELGPVADVPSQISQRLDELTEQIREWRKEWEEIREERWRLKARSQPLRDRGTLGRHAAEIEALDRQRPRILALEEDVAQRQLQVEELEFEWQARLEELGLPASALGEGVPRISDQVVKALRVPGRELKACRKRVAAAKRVAADCHREAGVLTERLEDASLRRGGEEITSALRRGHHLLARLERRRELDEQHRQIDARLDAMRQENRYWLQRGVLPWRSILVAAAFFAFGATLLLTGLLGDRFGLEHANRWTMVLIGGSLATVSLVLKSACEQTALRRAGECEKQIESLCQQQQRARAESQELDPEIPHGPERLEQRLQQARRDLAEMDELVPVCNRLGAVRREAHAADRQVLDFLRQLKEARQAWQATLRALGLPEMLKPPHVRTMSTRLQELTQLHERALGARVRLEERQQELTPIRQRIEQLLKLADAGDAGDAGDVAGDLGQQLDRLVAELEDHVRSRRQCASLRKRWEKLGKRQRQIAESAGRLRDQRRQLFAECGITDLHDYRQTRSLGQQARDLRHQRDQMLTQIGKVLSPLVEDEDDVPVDALCKWLDKRPDALGDHLEKLDARRKTLETGLRELYERRGHVLQQIDAQARDRRPEKTALARQVMDETIRAAAGHWLRSAMTTSILDRVRQNYERHRQPVTLTAASSYLKRLTEGHYTRVWTPFERPTLYVDHHSGTLPVEKLSRGTREQVFLALRLALVESYRRRGITMPMVLDDVLVNFDDSRARAAAQVLTDFAAAGQQLLIFTCHQRIRNIFAELGGDVRNLPRSAASLDPPSGERVVPPEPPESAQEKSVSPTIPNPIRLLTPPLSAPHPVPHRLADHDARGRDLTQDEDNSHRSGAGSVKQRFTPDWRDEHLKPLPDLATGEGPDDDAE